MHTMQGFLVVVLSGFVSTTIILGLALAQVRTFDKGWGVKEGVQDGKIYGGRVKGCIEGGWVYARNWNFGERIKNGKIYARHRNLNGCFENGRIHERNWARRSA